MERLTIDTKILFCDIAQCQETPGGSFCEDGYCDQRRVYERLREYERLGDIDDPTAIAKAQDEGRVVVHGRVAENGNPICGPCSNCGESVNRKWNFCPHCGAKMDAPAQ